MRSSSSLLAFLDREIAGRRYPQQVLDEVVPSPAYQIGISPFSVVHVGNKQHVEVLVGLDQGIDETHGLDRVYVVVDIPVFQEQMAPDERVGSDDWFGISFILNYAASDSQSYNM